MTGLLAHPDRVAAARTLLARMRAAGWEHLLTGINASPWEHSWQHRDTLGRHVILDDVGNVFIYPTHGAPWRVPLISAHQIGAVLELAGVIPPLPRRRNSDQDETRDEMYPQPGDTAPDLPPHIHGYPVGGRASHHGGRASHHGGHTWQNCPDLAGPYAATGGGEPC